MLIDPANATLAKSASLSRSCVLAAHPPFSLKLLNLNSLTQISPDCSGPFPVPGLVIPIIIVFTLPRFGFPLIEIVLLPSMNS